MAEAATDAAVARQARLGYWAARKTMLYYQALYYYAAVVGHDAKTVIDIGCGGTDYINWLNWIPERYALDIRVPRPPPGVTAIETDFLKYEPERKFDLVLCCQVLEHVIEVEPFCKKLKEIGRHLIVSVPYKWLGNAPGHINDPVDEEKLRGWMGLQPNNSQVVYEPLREGRLIAYYNLIEGPRFRFRKEFVLSAIAEHCGD